ncbi:hypothetical protein AVEN_264744-1 [Araneus ventricosus]|uniref:Uncharacterized protein n=1 Tax=Araneus ventricosus TaxID=182803 RepID=A0A4Y2EDM6_ARAVE|nr:hypothetical protein AVEN_264744-1 [Araneus ventricosus]
MAFLARCKKLDLARFAEDLGIEITPEDRVIDIFGKIKTSSDFEEERAYELEKLRIISVVETPSLGSTRREGSRSRREIKNLMQKFDAQMSDISLYLTLFERQARTTGIEEEEWVPQLISLLPLELTQIIIKESEEKMRDYVSVREVLLNRFKMKPGNFLLKFTQHQRKSGALWKEMVFELRNYLEGWLDGLDV